jgi:pimeloyl-ACP methyl ester carboxylesterase
MQRRAFELQAEAGDVAEAPDPLEGHPELLERIAVPALVAAGEHDMSDFIEGAELMAGALPNARHEVIAGTGHLAPLESPEAFRGLLIEFLRAASET